MLEVPGQARDQRVGEVKLVEQPPAQEAAWILARPASVKNGASRQAATTAIRSTALTGFDQVLGGHANVDAATVDLPGAQADDLLRLGVPSRNMR